MSIYHKYSSLDFGYVKSIYINKKDIVRAYLGKLLVWEKQTATSIPPHCLRFYPRAISSVTLSLQGFSDQNLPRPRIKYCILKSENNNTANTFNSYTFGTSIMLMPDQVLCIKNQADTLSLSPKDYAYFTTTGQFAVRGSITAMLNNKSDIPPWSFYKLFYATFS